MNDCHTCGKTFADRAQLNRHLNGKRPCKAPGSSEPTQCIECGKQFSTPSNLKKHMRMVHSDIKATAPGKCCQTINVNGGEVHNCNNSTVINVSVNITAPKNFVCPDIDFLENMPAQKLKDMIGDPASPAAIAKLFSEIYLDDSKPSNHSVLLESLTSDTGYCFNEKWRREATEALITQCASNTALKLADFEHVYETILSKKNAETVTNVCETIEREDFTGELYGLLRDKITETLVDFTARKTSLLEHAKTQAKTGVKYPKSTTIEGWRLGGELREAAIRVIRALPADTDKTAQ